ncbi:MULTISPECIES: HAMP domain-containing sensor histidine kinase [unclassified Ruminococcus]|uniref:HAMP domain-containing sensor histidine kinase n=1 Tax=unclassified Ruminococcus TaxID=2608920 RepID=UPI00210B0910|nr:MULTISPECIES: HAMP domain-containing sensor histidine kinase [unclassified Ruminococcus]MCQ4022076.1 sensor histidine kinase [Ruminococcus sp. zg-924]MCQ4114396.1 sensor histidine kinase [Ruminococcus sp. zg-921]
MKGFKVVLAAVISVIIAVFVAVNILFLSQSNDESGRPYRVEASRIEQAILNGESFDLSEYNYITAVEVLDENNKSSFYNTDSDFLIKEIDGSVYRFEYKFNNDNSNMLVLINIALTIMAVVVIVILFYIYFKMVKPFNTLCEVPFELAKGNLTIALKENKNRFFGRFVWGLDLLREKLEQQKTQELALQKDKKTLVLSLSHDIKTPLGIIELYAKALEKNLYKEEEKKNKIAASISGKCDEIRGYVDEIIKASNEDFLNLSVNNGEFYLSAMINEIKRFYSDKLDLLKIEFIVNKYCDCLLKGDIDRGVEVLQNIIENAVKYGDGKSISLSFAHEEDCIIVSVSNTGSQLSDSELTHIFDSFWRGSNVGSNTGSGLGLYICRRLMKKMDGDIFAECKDKIMTVSAVFRMV